MTNPSTRVGQAVQELRKSQGLSAQSLSSRLEQLGHRIAQSSISKIEAGKRAVDVDDLVALAVALRTTPNRLLLGGRAGMESVALTPKVATTGQRAWSWANGEYPLNSTYPRGMSEVDIYDEFFRQARPVDFRARQAHPAYRAARRLAGLVDGFIALLSSRPGDKHLLFETVGEVVPAIELSRERGELGDATGPAAVVDHALHRATMEITELLSEVGGEAPPQ